MTGTKNRRTPVAATAVSHLTSSRGLRLCPARLDPSDKCQLIDQRLKELGSAEKKAEG